MVGKTLKMAVVAGLFLLVAAGIATAAVALAGGTPTSPAPVTDVKGPCDEAEHANDPECAGPQVPEDDPTVGPTATPSPAATPSPFDDDGDEDNSGPGNAGDDRDDGDEDNSGPGNAGDDEDEGGDDRSGSNRGQG